MSQLPSFDSLCRPRQRTIPHKSRAQRTQDAQAHPAIGQNAAPQGSASRYVLKCGLLEQLQPCCPEITEDRLAVVVVEAASRKGRRLVSLFSKDEARGTHQSSLVFHLQQHQPQLSSTKGFCSPFKYLLATQWKCRYNLSHQSCSPLLSRLCSDRTEQLVHA